MAYPTELVEKARYEVHVFERVARDTGIALIAEVERLMAENEGLRERLSTPRSYHTHECIACHHAYTPSDDESEDCPACGCDGTSEWTPNV